MSGNKRLEVVVVVVVGGLVMDRIEEFIKMIIE